MLISYKRSQGSIILRIKIPNSTATDNSGVTGLTFSTTNLSISTIADNEASPVSYTSAGSTIETITTLGTYAAPTATKCRFKEVSSTLHPGIYEIQLADARFAVSSAKSLLLTILAITASSAAQIDCLIPLVDLDPYSATVNLGSAGIDNIVEDGYDLRETIYLMAAQILGKLSNLPSSPATARSLNDSADRVVTTFDADNNRTSLTLTPP